MAVTIGAEFDSGNIQVLDATDPGAIRLAIRPDRQSGHFQWFHFEATGLVPGQPYHFRLENAGRSSYNRAWAGYNAVASEDGEQWFRVPSQFDGQALSFSLHAPGPRLRVAYFEPYSRERHARLIGRALTGGLQCIARGRSGEGRDIELLQAGDGAAHKRKLWLIAQQHPGEHMAEWFMEGAIDYLLSGAPALQGLLKHANLYLIPNMNPDGAFHGHLRTNSFGQDLNRAWQQQAPMQAPEAHFAFEQMQAIGVDAFIDVHGDEEIPHVFTAACEGNPGYTPRIARLEQQFRDLLCAQTPDFQQTRGYPRSAPGRANMALACNAVGQRFDCLSLTLEMPFKDHDDNPAPATGWNGQRSAQLGKAVLIVLAKMAGALRA
ncbi:M14 family metallopeptidase [Pseudomonas typographi]|uniref:Carboxypeptidase family protein n=1 Tax=Pseudomonas typographi TaxID=2715964 RepID=A0ABR7Z9G7_9PSED|nr:M14-type cytosolic carboxypeptidase [Pseudomonas typographi]MBD1555126.1 carboxypeptidase family protein [Pseudomonas typographi]MBD1590156.1 carboxypeptidase family protein [Pseudomonas typographi]MBD1602191.1 carboxypeptidase family protein [Pseudomonas typographi]